MNCASFERRLERYQEGTLPEAERREADQHLYHCPACRGLFELLQMAETQAPGQLDVSQAVLSRTTGSTCRKCKNLLTELVDSSLDPIENELVLSHLDSCPACADLFRVMSEMSELLPQMRELTPDSSFVPDVLRSVRALQQRRSGLSGVLEFFRGLWQRPRFSWEAAYLGALLVFALFGAPFSPVHDASARLLASLQNPEGLVADVGSKIEIWSEDARIAVAASERARQAVGQMTSRSLDAGELVITQARYYLGQAENYLATARKGLQSKIGKTDDQTKGSKVPPKR